MGSFGREFQNPQLVVRDASFRGGSLLRPFPPCLRSGKLVHVTNTFCLEDYFSTYDMTRKSHGDGSKTCVSMKILLRDTITEDNENSYIKRRELLEGGVEISSRETTS
ncbi:hypothetical protein Y032_0187g1121 [Ancylostoma ceylanicum]|uniref:Uncharacterized protein n=1 Tax=Ancylostoma ceylanicum TaxID=53326 RepID=A0A016SRN0_9BILA|nr:hypothetical protein Y032_0187g1121 [Ancylostoma ceylanicum]